MNLAFLLIGLAFCLALVIVAMSRGKETKEDWYGWYEHTDPFWEKVASHPSEPLSPAGDDTC